ncbi:MAG: transcriptional regulator [Spirochaetaceae bacterium]|nr:MAG: transcriptional regulator [Spirochaetaceae bacterium]
MNPVTAAVAVLGGKRKSLIVHAVQHGHERLRRIQKAAAEIHPGTLCDRLSPPERLRIVGRHVIYATPRYTGYRLTERGLARLPTAAQTTDWSEGFSGV